MKKQKDETWKGRKPPPAVSQRWYREAKEFVDKANGHYCEARRGLIATLQHAKQAGEALMEAKRRVPYKKWGKFLQANFEGSGETARVYMRVARNWQDERIIEARRGGMTPSSIDGFLRIIRAESPRNGKDKKGLGVGEKDGPKFDKEWKFKGACQCIREDFAGYLRNLRYEEVMVLEEFFSRFWYDMYENLKKAVHKVYEDDAKYIDKVYRDEITEMRELKKEVRRGWKTRKTSGPLAENR